eukprot:scaffold77138_cov15-Tisochrysis_lutea.AAC.2
MAALSGCCCVNQGSQAKEVFKARKPKQGSHHGSEDCAPMPNLTFSDWQIGGQLCPTHDSITDHLNRRTKGGLHLFMFLSLSTSIALKSCLLAGRTAQLCSAATANPFYPCR